MYPNEFPDAGAVYVFTDNSGTWSQTQQMVDEYSPSDYEYFGSSLSSSDGTVAVGAIGWENDSLQTTGGVFLLTYNGSNWVSSGALTSSDGTSYDDFGAAVSISGTEMAVSATNQKVGSNSAQGEAYVFTYSGGSWSQTTTLTASDGAANDHLGGSLAISGTTVLAASDAHNSDQGAVYEFTPSGSSWSQTELTASDGAAGDYFGSTVRVLRHRGGHRSRRRTAPRQPEPGHHVHL